MLSACYLTWIWTARNGFKLLDGKSLSTSCSAVKTGQGRVITRVVAPPPLVFESLSLRHFYPVITETCTISGSAVPLAIQKVYVILLGVRAEMRVDHRRSDDPHLHRFSPLLCAPAAHPLWTIRRNRRARVVEVVVNIYRCGSGSKNEAPGCFSRVSKG